MYIAGPYRS